MLTVHDNDRNRRKKGKRGKHRARRRKKKRWRDAKKVSSSARSAPSITTQTPVLGSTRSLGGDGGGQERGGAADSGGRGRLGNESFLFFSLFFLLHLLFAERDKEREEKRNRFSDSDLWPLSPALESQDHRPLSQQSIKTLELGRRRGKRSGRGLLRGGVSCSLSKEKKTKVQNWSKIEESKLFASFLFALSLSLHAPRAFQFPCAGHSPNAGLSAVGVEEAESLGDDGSHVERKGSFCWFGG